jgi:chromosome segregation ATPase
VLGLAMPVNAWYLFPVREKIVTVKETNYAVTAVCAAIPTILAIISGIYGIYMHRQDKIKYDSETKRLNGIITNDNRNHSDAVQDIENACNATIASFRNEMDEAIAAKDTEIARLNEVLESKGAEITRLNETLAERNAEIESLNQRLRELQTNYDHKDNDYINLQRELANVNQTLSGLTGDKATDFVRMQAEITRLTNVNKELTESFEKVKEGTKQLRELLSPRNWVYPR